MRKFKHKKTEWTAQTHPTIPDTLRLKCEDELIALPIELFNPNDWQELKDYEILRYKGVAPIEIHSVKRLSDGEVFGVGGNAQHKAGLHDGRIEKITEEDGEVRIHFRFASIRLEDADKISRKPKLTTEDGVELFDGDKYCRYDINTGTIAVGKISEGSLFNYTINNLDKYKVFSTREAAEEYRVNNYRGLSVMDVYETIGLVAESVVKLKNLVKSRLK